MDSVVFKNQYSLQQAAGMIRSCSESGMPVKEWLRKNEISRDKYYYWKRKLRNICLDEICPSFVEIPADTCHEIPEEQAGSVSASLRVGNVSVDIYDTATSTFLQRLLEAAGHAQ